MRARSLIALLAALAAAVSLAALASGCGSTSATLDPVAQAAEATTRASGAEMAFTGTVSAPGLTTPLTLAGGGHFNLASHEGELSLTMSGLPAAATQKLGGGQLSMTELFKASALYIGSPLFSGKLPGGVHWMKLDLTKVSQAIGLDPSSLTSGGANPAQYLDYLKAAGASTSVVGHESVRGVRTTHYAGTINLLKAAEAQPGTNVAQARKAFAQLAAEIGGADVPVQVWVDDHHLVRKLTLTLSIAHGGQQASTTIESEYFGFGPTPTVNVPAAGEAFDITPQALQGLAGAQ